MEKEAQSDHSDVASILSADEPMFDNVFAKKDPKGKPGTSKQHHDNTTKDILPHHSLPKMHFPVFDGSNPRIWIDKCNNYFTIYSIAANLQVIVAVKHLEGNAAKWWQAYK